MFHKGVHHFRGWLGVGAKVQYLTPSLDFDAMPAGEF